MALDSIMLSCIIDELNHSLNNGRIDKIYQPESDEIILHVRNHGQNHRLVLSASAHNPRIHLSANTKDNPVQPPMFCMLLRKYLLNGKIVSFSQPYFERIVHIIIESKNEMSDVVFFTLIIEIMGRHSNIILIDQENNILDSIKHITERISRKRQILPGLLYWFPLSAKINPLEVNQNAFNKILINRKTDDLYAFLAENFVGITSTTAHEIGFLLIRGDDSHIDLNIISLETLYNAFHQFIEKIITKSFQCTLYYRDDNEPFDFSAIKYSHLAEVPSREYDSPSRLIEDYYYIRDIRERMAQRTQNMTQIVKVQLNRAEKKLSKQSIEKSNAENYQLYKHLGELLIINMHLIEKGSQKLSVVDFTNNEYHEIEIPLNKTLSPSQNAQRYFKKYHKAKNALRVLEEQMYECENLISYYRSLLFNISKCTTEFEVLEIRDELIDQGMLKQKSKGKRKKAYSQPLHFFSANGYHIFVGKNNYQNDYLTMKKAKSNDIWFHTKLFPGAHVILSVNDNQDINSVPDTAIIEAASLAAYYSQARQADKIEIDYCLRKNIRKPNGSKPGMVIYDNYFTVTITNAETTVKQLKQDIYQENV